MERKSNKDIITVVKSLSTVILDSDTRIWCKLSYPNHSRGCPNYGKREICPPQAPLFNDIVKKPFLLVGVRFNLSEWAKHLKEKYPKWSDKQARCCLYWQNTVRKRLREECEKLSSKNKRILYVPEANGVHVFKTCETVGIILERNPKVFVWKIAIIGERI